MADIKFSEFPKANQSKDTDELAILQDGVNKMIASPVLESKIINKTVSRVLDQGGASLNLINPIAVVPTYADLALITPTPSINDAYQVESDGLVYVYTENGFQDDGDGFKVQPNVNGVIEEDNPNAVNGGEVFNSLKDVISFKSEELPFNLSAGSIRTETGIPNTSVNWLYASVDNILENKDYKILGYSIDNNSAGRRVFFFNNSNFISYINSTSDSLVFTTPPTCNNILIQVASEPDVGLDIPNSEYWESLKVLEGLNDESYIIAENIKGNIETPQISSFIDNFNTENDFFSNKFDFTENIGVNNYKRITMLDSTSINHLNFASTKDTDVSKLSIKIDSIESNSSIRLGFGNINGGYLLVTEKTSTVAEMYEMSNYGIVKIGQITYDSTTINIGDVITIRRNGAMISMYINNMLKGSFTLISNGFAEFRTSALIGFRDITRNYEASEINISKRNSPYMHISVDDTLQLLRELTINTYTSIFESPRLAFYKQMNEKYGSVFSFYLFYQNSNGSFNISQVPNTYKEEFIANSHWLKFGFHGVDSVTNYSIISMEDMVIHYNQIVNEIIRFSSISNLDVIPRFSMFGGNTDNLIELKKYGLLGVLTADDSRVDNAGLDSIEKVIVQNSDDYYAYDRDLYYVKTEYRLDSATDESVLIQLNSLKNNIDNNNIYEMFYHENKDSSQEGKDMIEAMCKWSYDNRIRFDYPQNNIFR